VAGAARSWQELLEAFAIFGHVDGIRRCPDDRHAGALELPCEFQWCLAAKLHDDPFWALGGDDLEYVFQRQGLEVEPVRGVVIGRDRLRVAVDHD